MTKIEKLLIKEPLGRYILLIGNVHIANDEYISLPYVEENVTTGEQEVLIFLRKIEALIFGIEMGLNPVEIISLGKERWGMLKEECPYRFVDSKGEQIQYEEFDE